jgi:hypothetical protein
MDDAYVEMKGVPDMKGSINTVISSQRKLYRPPSLSESCAWTPENVLRATASNTSLDLLVSAPSPQSSPQTSPQPPPPVTPSVKPRCQHIVNILLRFLFHITLISIFESVFFFMYVSMLEDNGINKTVGGFIDDAVSVCDNFTIPERQVTNDVLSLFLNSTIIINAGNSAYSSRSITNRSLFNRSWVYVGSLGGLFLLCTALARFNKINIKWKKLIFENMGLVTLLAAYEYLFFSTVIFPYDPISGSEIARNAVYELQDHCGLLTRKN